MADLAKISLEKICDISKAEQLHEQLEAMLSSQTSVEIDASAVERIDTSTLQMLVVFIRTLAKHHVDARIAHPSAYFSDTANQMGLADHLPVLN